MKIKKFKISKVEKEKFLDVMTLLGYKVDHVKEVGDNLIYYLYKEDNAQRAKLDMLEKKYIPYVFPIWTLIPPSVAVIILMTSFLIIHFGKLIDLDKFYLFLIFFVPSAILLGVDVLLFTFRANALNRIAINQKDLYKIISEELKKE